MIVLNNLNVVANKQYFLFICIYIGIATFFVTYIHIRICYLHIHIPHLLFPHLRFGRHLDFGQICTYHIYRTLLYTPPREWECECRVYTIPVYARTLTSRTENARVHIPTHVAISHAFARGTDRYDRTSRSPGTPRTDSGAARALLHYHPLFCQPACRC